PGSPGDGRGRRGPRGGWGGARWVGGHEARCRATAGGGVSGPPPIQYAKTADGVHVAYQVLGDGPLDLVLMPLGLNHMELTWEMPAFARVFRRLASFSRLIRFDQRGAGMSDPLGRFEQPSLEGRAEEMVAVLDAVGSQRVAGVANNGGGPLGVLFARP